MTRINVFNGYGSERSLAGWFDLESAEAIEGTREWDGQNMADVHVGANRRQTLYRTVGGQYVLSTESAWQGEQTTYRFVDAETARTWLLANESDDVAKRWFGEVEAERGPGRPAVGEPIKVRLGDELQARVDAARRDGETRSEAIRRLLGEALSARRER